MFFKVHFTIWIISTLIFIGAGVLLGGKIDYARDQTAAKIMIQMSPQGLSEFNVGGI